MTGINKVLEEYPPGRSSTKGLMTRHIIKTDDGIASVEEYKGKIMRVARLTFKPSWLKYEQLKHKLDNLYGGSEDKSYYPEYSDSQSEKAISIKLEKGRAMHVWDQGDWEVEILWANRRSMGLIYIAKELEREFSNKNNEGL